MTPDYKVRRDEAAEKYSPLGVTQQKHWKRGADWGRADLMREVEEILVKALESVASPHLNGYKVHQDMALEALTKWQAIKGEK